MLDTRIVLSETVALLYATCPEDQLKRSLHFDYQQQAHRVNYTVFKWPPSGYTIPCWPVRAPNQQTLQKRTLH